MKRTFFTSGALVALTFLFVGCGPPNSHFRAVKTSIFQGNESLNTNVELSLGAVPIWLAGTIAGFIDEPEVKEASQYIDHISRIDLGVYELQDSLKGRFKETSQRVQSSMKEHGFEPMVLVYEKNESVGIYIPTTLEESARQAFVVVMEQKQVVLVRVRGDFEKLFKAVYHNHRHELPILQQVLKEEVVL